jgi:integrase
LRELHQHTGSGTYLFPALASGAKPICNNTINKALACMGFGAEIVGHGFRAMFRTLADEVLKERVDYIEHQLAHVVRDPMGRAYNRTQHLDERRVLMQRWSDYLDSLRTAAMKQAAVVSQNIVSAHASL